MFVTLPSLSYRRLRRDMIEVYKILNGKYDQDACTILKLWKDMAPRIRSRFFFPICMCLHLSGWNLNSHVLLHSSSLVKSSCSIVESSLDMIILNILVSSALSYSTQQQIKNN
jgi:hypothetical protein